MEQQEIDNETPAVAPPKPKRAPRKKAAAAPVEETPEAVEAAPMGEQAPSPAEDDRQAEASVAPQEDVAEIIEAKPVNGNGSSPAAAKQQQPAAETLDIRILKEMKLPDLTRVAKDLGVENATGMRKQDLIFGVLQAQTEKS